MELEKDKDNEKTKEGFIKFDKSLIKGKRGKDRKLLVMAYLKIYSSISGHINFSLNHLIRQIGYTPDRHKGRINSKVKDLLLDLERYGHIYILSKINELSDNDCLIIQVEEKSELFNPSKDFVILTQSEFDKIVTSKSKCDKQDILSVFLNIKKFINFGSYTNRLCYPSHVTLCRDCHIKSTGAMNNIVDALIKDEIIYKYNSGRYKDSNGNIKYVNNLYALEDGVLKSDICDDIIKAHYLSQGITIERFIKNVEE